MAKDFHTRFTCVYNGKPGDGGNVLSHNIWTEENVVFTIILIITYFLSPVGLTIYFLATRTYFQQFAASQPINWRNPQNLKIKKIVSAVDYRLLFKRTIRFGDSLPDNLRTFYRFITGLIGSFSGLIVLGFYAIYIVYCLIFHRNKTSTIENSPRWPPASVRAHTIESFWHSIITPIENRDWLWKVKSYWLQICTFILFAPNGENPFALFRAMQHDFAES
ncbi:unnamed protein product [Adineta steineri]|nr:unnamed protein product [Adineta steineri]